MALQIMYPGMVNSPETTLTNGISESDTIIYVLDPARVPEPPNLMTLGTGTNAETVKVLEMNDNAITVERGFQGIPKAWPAGTVIARNFTEYDYNALKENIEDLEATKETPQGAQEKADAALNSAKQYTDQEVGEVAQALTTHLAETASGASPPHGMGAAAAEDYEEGNWTPEIDGNHIYNQQYGEYTKIGDTVIAHFWIQISEVDAQATGILTISGLPFMVKSLPSGGMGYTGSWGRILNVSFPANTIDLRLYLPRDGAHVRVIAIKNNDNDEFLLAENALANLSTLYGTVIYKTV